jgi:DNA replication protein DnaC
MTRRRQVTEQAAAAAIEQGCRMLRLPTIRDRFAEIAAAAEREQLSYLGFLSELVIAECDDRTRRRAERRIRDAGFPRSKRLEEFSFEANPTVNPAIIGQLATCAWVKAGHPLCLIGDSGTGKSHLLIALGALAAEAGYRVRYTLASKLVNELVEAADDKQLTKLIARYGRVDLILVDEFLSQESRGCWDEACRQRISARSTPLQNTSSCWGAAVTRFVLTVLGWSTSCDGFRREVWMRWTGASSQPTSAISRRAAIALIRLGRRARSTTASLRWRRSSPS